MKRELIDASQLELEETVVSIKRVTKVVKGGRNMRFAALVVVGDKNGHVGAGLGKAIEIPEAIRKGKEDAMKKLVKVPVNEVGSIPHDFIGKFGSAEVLLKASPEGTGIIAGGPSRAVLELAGYKNIRSKALGSNNKQNVVLATIAGLKEIKTPEEVARLRVVTIDTLIESGLVKNTFDGVKILGNGELSKKLTVQVNAFSKSAVAKIEAAGGKAEVI